MAGFKRSQGVRRRWWMSLAPLWLTTVPAAAQTAPNVSTQKVYAPTIGESSAPVWPQRAHPSAGAPNVLVIMTDDVGFGASSTFGGPVPTPAFDGLAQDGLRYNNFNTTAICSPTRASLLTGRNPQAVGMGYAANWASGYDGYNTAIPKSAGTVARILRDTGYNTAMFGKGHVTPEWEMSQSGPFDRWPTGLGFDYFYGFLGADTDMFAPSLVENTRTVTPRQTPDYHLENDLADHAIGWIAEQHATAPDRPFFVYYATGTAHAPNQAPRAWLDRFRGKFDGGWDELRADIVKREKRLGVIPANTDDAPRPATLPRWAGLTSDQRRLYARYMEAYAASLAYADHEIGRVIDFLKKTGQYENTVIVYIQGDNGASAEGSFDGALFEQSRLSQVKETEAYSLAHIDDIGTGKAYNLYPGGWGWAMNAPFPWAKRYASHFGGTRNAMVVSWGAGIRNKGGLRSQFHHVSDVMPTILDIVGAGPPAAIDGVAQQPIDGISMRYTFDQANVASRRTTQVFGIAQNLSIYHDGWVAATAPFATPWEATKPKPVAVDDRRWQLYNVATDFSEAHDLAAADPKRLESMKALFWSQAALAGILPIHTSEGQQKGRPDPNEGRSKFVYDAPISGITESAAPPIIGRSYDIEADIVVPEKGGQGVILAQGGHFGGHSLYLDHGRLTFTHNLTPAHVSRVSDPAILAPGHHIVRMSFTRDSDTPADGGIVTLNIDGREVARGHIAQTVPVVISHTEGLDIGRDGVTSVDDRYTVADSIFNGEIKRVTVQLR